MTADGLGPGPDAHLKHFFQEKIKEIKMDQENLDSCM
jgi:hypothetical protein